MKRILVVVILCLFLGCGSVKNEGDSETTQNVLTWDEGDWDSSTWQK